LSATFAGGAEGTAYALVKDQVSDFAENSKILMNVMDELGKAHPFVLGKMRFVGLGYLIAYFSSSCGGRLQGWPGSRASASRQ
jgi:hypothetical protein